jgi:hypothetical protein
MHYERRKWEESVRNEGRGGLRMEEEKEKVSEELREKTEEDNKKFSN